ncbi:biotin synthase BioB [Cyanobacterium sp. HL-69]|uniref:biotin synthase BioB n=1 Tax=Cyanobacterium sp. HL-69 TaxID=2054282 RepID=UPI00406BB406
MHIYEGTVFVVNTISKPEQNIKNISTDNNNSLAVWLRELGDRIIGGDKITKEEALQITTIEGEENILLLCENADRIRQACCGNVVDLCSIVNVKSGNCSENCSFCSQSVHHQGKDSPVYGLKSEDEILEYAKAAEAAGAKRFCLVSQGRGVKYNSPKNNEFAEIISTVRRIITETNVKPCCALGEITQEQAQELKEAGVTRYNHNLEASANFYEKIVTTHTWQDRVDTVRNLKAVGIQACTGGIMGMGESWEDRVDLALSLRELEVESVPINLLNPREGTPLGEQNKLTPLQALKAIALFRFILPQQILRYAGGRETVMGEWQKQGLISGINAMLIGNYLTTLGQSPQEDQAMLKSLGLEGGEAPVPYQDESIG